MKRLLFVVVLLTIIIVNSNGQTKKKPVVDKLSKLKIRILDTIAHLPEVKKRMQYVERVTHNKRHLQVILYQKPSKKENYYWVTVMEDNGMSYYTHFNFFVNPKTLLIKYSDTSIDDMITLEEWRKSRNHPKE
ncbi:MAG: hypothetical protein ABIN91_17390 [Mucilaginibacter sp.]|uniref:hypothetical protein n=1 Tax=Mucilaginibacter sp. TaxID=1882438 RepID=UPI003266A82F